MSSKDSKQVVSEEEISKAYYFWLNLAGIYKNEEKVFHLFDVKVPKEKSWLKISRVSSFTTMDQVATKLSISKSAYSRIEKAEQDGKLTLKTLAEAAEAMDCELVYFIRPYSRITFSNRVWNKILKVCFKTRRFKSYRKGFIAQPLAHQAFEILKSAKFRKENNLIKTWPNQK